MIRSTLWRAAIAAFALHSFPGQAQLRPDHIRRAGDWMLVCDNRRSCTILGAPAADILPHYPRVIMRFTRAHRPQAPLLLQSIAIGVTGTANRPLPSLDNYALSQAPMGNVLGHFQPDRSRSSGNGVDFYNPIESNALARIIADDRPAYVRSGMGAAAALPVGDFAALLSLMDRAQPDVFRSPASAPLQADASAPIVIAPFHQVTAAVIHPRFTAPCRRAPYTHSRGYAVGASPDDPALAAMLVLVFCHGEDRAYLWNQARSGDPRPLATPAMASRRGDIMTASVDDRHGLFRLVYHAPGGSDCGEAQTWGWSIADGMVMLRRQIMPICRQIPVENWPVVFHHDRWSGK